ncbi:MAG: type III-A CRISPR-associated RAMP protein Csm4 [Methanosphaera sp.]|nr:type III-A CRISPR-associated RAMP protein Csm4 [Methanosphaera sp.]
MIIYINPKSTFPHLHSDTIFGALCKVLSEFYPNFMDELINDFENKPPFILSSTYPYIQLENSKKHLLPKINIVSKVTSNNPNTITQAKKYKKVKYLDEEIFLDLIHGTLTSNDIIHDIDEYTIKSNILTKENYGDYKYTSTVQHNNIIHRINDSSLNVFYTEGLQFKNMGLYFLLKIYDKKYEKIIKTGLKLLQDRGFGANISTGHGQFTHTIEENSEFEEKLLANEGEKIVTLSRYIPTATEIKKIDSDSSYSIASKRGINSNGELKKKISFFEEGSIFTFKQEYYGKLTDVSTITPAIEYGYAFAVKIGGK